MSKDAIGIVWFRQDLRLADNPALVAACKDCEQLVLLFIDDPADQTVSTLGAASRVWLHHSLDSLKHSLQDKENSQSEKTNSLYFFQGNSLDVLQSVISATGASRIYWNRCYDPVTIERDKKIKSALEDQQPKTFNGLLVCEPWDNLKDDGTPYRVYTPFWRKAAAQLDVSDDAIRVARAPRNIPALSAATAKKLKTAVELKKLGLLPELDWHTEMISHWQVGEHAARAQLDRFLKSTVQDYDKGRDTPGIVGTSRLSPHLHFGEISPRYAMQRLLDGRKPGTLEGGELTFAKEVFWREFAYSLIYHFPHTVDEPLDKRFRRFPWASDTDADLKAWQRGRTGVPIVDAGMRELYATGWMHNRVRMIVASYLIKNLLIEWQSGENWFRDTLVDADTASNAMGWQWTAGSGADAAPFFRVFNPVLQGEKFDKQGDYVRKWVPELAEVSDRFLHKPWELPGDDRQKIDYPEPLVDLKETRKRALEAFDAIKGTKSGG